ncbi:uncharacterized protein LOC142917085 [Petromyzon marinus]|uniref:uncharacterized protein LOC142917085 n=1 Tax=Petromyzon marinus TaxID=7757 RepID=UPI003F71DD1E
MAASAEASLLTRPGSAPHALGTPPEEPAPLTGAEPPGTAINAGFIFAGSAAAAAVVVGGLRSSTLAVGIVQPMIDQSNRAGMLQEEAGRGECGGEERTQALLVSDCLPCGGCPSAGERVLMAQRNPKQLMDVLHPPELLHDFHPKKKQKTKGVYKTKSRQPLCTSQIFAQDEHTTQTELFSAKFELAQSSAAKRRMSLKPVLGTNLFQKNPKHVSVLSESSISYEKPLSPVQVAALRAERIAKEKKDVAAAGRVGPPPPDLTADQPQWLVNEDWALLQAIQQLLELPLNLAPVSPAHTPNWELVSDVVNVVSRVYRSPKHCRSRYEAVVVPREDGKLLYDFHPKKKQKTKGVYKTKSRQPLCTSQIFAQDEHTTQTELFSAKFELARSSAAKRRMSLKPVLGTNLFQKNPKRVSVPSESGISYETPLSPVQVAALRAERIAKEKKLRKAEHKMDEHKCE